MLEIIKQLALDAAEKGADFCVGTVTKAAPLTIRLEEGLAMRQAVSKILQTERYRYAVYDWNYGVELEDLYGKNVSYVIPELKRRIEDALLADDRVTAVTDFSFREEKGSVTAAFTVYTIFGEVTAERTVDI